MGRSIEHSDGDAGKKFDVVEFTTTDNDEAFQNITIYNIAAGDEHVLALDYHYNVWAWGKNKYNQISPKIKEETIRKPIKVTLVLVDYNI